MSLFLHKDANGTWTVGKDGQVLHFTDREAAGQPRGIWVRGKTRKTDAAVRVGGLVAVSSENRAVRAAACESAAYSQGGVASKRRKCFEVT